MPSVELRMRIRLLFMKKFHIGFPYVQHFKPFGAATMDEDPSHFDFEDYYSLLVDIEDWDGIDLDILDDMMRSIRFGVDAHDERVTDWCRELLERDLPPFYRARLNFYLAFEPGQSRSLRLEIAEAWIV